MNYFATSIITFVINNHSHIETVLAKFTIFIKKKNRMKNYSAKSPPQSFEHRLRMQCRGLPRGHRQRISMFHNLNPC